MNFIKATIADGGATLEASTFSAAGAASRCARSTAGKDGRSVDRRDPPRERHATAARAGRGETRPDPARRSRSSSRSATR